VYTPSTMLHEQYGPDHSLEEQIPLQSDVLVLVQKDIEICTAIATLLHPSLTVDAARYMLVMTYSTVHHALTTHVIGKHEGRRK
jgi:hypothetical protein